MTDQTRHSLWKIAFWLRRMTRRALLCAALAFILLVVWFATAYPRGMLAARMDHAQGRYEVVFWTDAAPVWLNEYHRLLRDRYEIKARYLGGPEVILQMYDRGYNDYSMPRIIEQKGKDIFTECREEARATSNRN